MIGYKLLTTLVKSNVLVESESLPPGGLKLVSGSGCQPCLEQYMKACSNLEIEQIFTSFNNPKGSADNERVIRILKEKCIWSNGFCSFNELKTGLELWVEGYNACYLHSTLGNFPPNVFEKQANEKP